MLDCHLPDWDGHGAEPVSLEACRLAHTFVRNLPIGIPRPSVSADPGGCVTFEWQGSPRRLVLVSVHPDYRIDYAALFDGDKACATEPFFERASGEFLGSGLAGLSSVTVALGTVAVEDGLDRTKRDVVFGLRAVPVPEPEMRRCPKFQRGGCSAARHSSFRKVTVLSPPPMEPNPSSACSSSMTPSAKG